MTRVLILVVWFVVLGELGSGCGSIDSQPITDTVLDANAREDDGSVPIDPDAAMERSVGAAPALRVGTWNLKNFSRFGIDEFRFGDIRDLIAQLQPDILAVQEIKAAEAPWRDEGEAWDALVSQLDGYEGVRAQWRSEDTVVGLLYRTERIEIVGAKELFPTDSWSYPRAPLQVTVKATADEGEAQFDVIVLHLKAYSDVESRSRRFQAVQKLHALLAERMDAAALVLGDFNDSPHDPAEANIFRGTFMDNTSEYLFLTHLLPADTATTVGWPEPGQRDDAPGEFLDHAVMTHDLLVVYPGAYAEVFNRDPSYFTWWEQTYSDHFPVFVYLQQ